MTCAAALLSVDIEGGWAGIATFSFGWCALGVVFAELGAGSAGTAANVDSMDLFCKIGEDGSSSSSHEKSSAWVCVVATGTSARVRL